MALRYMDAREVGGSGGAEAHIGHGFSGVGKAGYSCKRREFSASDTRKSGL